MTRRIDLNPTQATALLRRLQEWQAAEALWHESLELVGLDPSVQIQRAALVDDPPYIIVAEATPPQEEP